MAILIIDCTNIRAGNAGGGVTHISEILNGIEDNDQPFSKVVVISNHNTLSRIRERSWMAKLSHPWLNKGLIFILLWKLIKFNGLLQRFEDALLFVPSGTYFGKFHPNAGMSRNMLIFDKNESRRYRISFHRLKFFVLNFVQRKAFENNDLIIFISQYAKQTIQKSLKRDIASMPVIHHGINPKFTQRPAIQKSIDSFSESNPFKLLYVSPITVYKHQIPLIRTIEKLQEAGFPIQLHLVGGSYPAYYKLFKRELESLKNFDRYIIYHGIVPYTKIEELYKSADGFIYSSTCENMPNILIEAMSSGLPICCSNYMPMPEFFGESPFYFDPTDEDSIYDVLKKFLSNPELRYKEANRSFELTKRFSWEKCSIDTFKALYSLKN